MLSYVVNVSWEQDMGPHCYSRGDGTQAACMVSFLYAVGTHRTALAVHKEAPVEWSSLNALIMFWVSNVCIWHRVYSVKSPSCFRAPGPWPLSLEAPCHLFLTRWLADQHRASPSAAVPDPRPGVVLPAFPPQWANSWVDRYSCPLMSAPLATFSLSDPQGLGVPCAPHLVSPFHFGCSGGAS